MSRKPLEFIPIAVTFSDIERGGESEEDPIEFGEEDRAILDAMKEDNLLFVLKTLPNDRYRVVVLMLFLNQLGYDFRYQDIASIWGQRKEAVFQTIQRMRRALSRAGIQDESALAVRAAQSREKAPPIQFAGWKYSSVRRPARGRLGLKGVTKRGQRYEASIKVAGKQRYLGRFDRAEDAARAYDKAVLQYFGASAFRNYS